MTDFDAQAIAGNEASVLAKRPYIATEGRNAGKAVIAVNSGRRDDKGNPLYVEQLTANATLRKDEWISLDEALITVARQRLTVVEDFRAAGLVQNVGGLGTIVSEWETASALTDARATMDGESLVEQDNQAFGLSGVPIPIIQKPFKISERQLQASRMRGASLDLSTGVEAAQAVARKTEDMLVNGLSLGKVDGYSVYGLTNHPSRSTLTLSYDWSDGATTGANIMDDILAMIKKAENDERGYGPYNLYVATDAAFHFRDDYTSSYSQTLMDRVLAIPEISNVRFTDKLATKNAVLVQMDRMTIDLAVASDITNVQWDSGSGWTHYFQHFAAWAPRLKADYDGHLAVVHGSK